MKRWRFIFLSSCIFWIGALGCQPQPEAIDGADGIGDPYYPQLGNGGYDVQKYTIVLDIDPQANSVKGKAIIEAQATQRLTSFNLDLQGLNIDSVSVNGSSATFSRADGEMTITPNEPLTFERAFTVDITYYGEPTTVLSQAIPMEVGWFHAEDGTIN